jgi:type IV secretion system protein VirD4
MRIRRPLFEGEMLVLGGCVLSMAAFFGMANRAARRLAENAEDLHGSARLATSDDVRETGLVQARQGVYVGGWFDPERRRLRYLRHNGPEHVLAFAPTRTGKGVGLVIPTLLAWDESAIIYDIKGENWAKTAGFRTSQGHVCLRFSPVEETTASRFNPLSEVRISTLRDVADAQNLAEMIVRTGKENPVDAHWQDNAVSLLTGMILHTCYSAVVEERTANMASLAGLLTRPGTPFEETLNEMLSYSHDPDLRVGWRDSRGLRTATHPVVAEKAQEFLDKADKERSGILSAAKTALTVYCDPLVARNTAASDFRISDLVNHERPISLYIVVPPSDRERLRNLTRLIFTLVVNRLTERMDYEGVRQKRSLHRLLLMVDEFPSLNRMEVFAGALSYMAGYGIKAFLIAQDILQIVEAYGPNESIVSNCHVRIAFAPNQVETAELLSKMTGTATVQKASFNFSGSRFGPIMSHINASVDHVQRPLMTADEIMRLKSPRKEGEGLAERIVEPGDMLIFVSGQYPILGMQMLYFFDPVLWRRASIPPPAAGRLPVVRQLSAPEESLPEEVRSVMEQAFCARLNGDSKTEG